jgi:hypothetical protein
MEDRVQFSKTQQPKPGSPEALQVGTYPYREFIGTLLRISDGTCPDIAFAVDTLTKFTHKPVLIRWCAAMHACIRISQHYYHLFYTICTTNSYR